MSILLYFLFVLLLVRLTKLETKFSILTAILITYVFYQHPSNIIDNIFKLKSKLSKNNTPTENIPEIISKEWYLYWKKYFNDIKEYNYENYFDIMKSLKHYHQLYNEIFSGLEMPKHHLDKLSMLQKEILNTIQSTIHNLPVTKNETLENILSLKLEHLKHELDYRLNEMRNFINKDWNTGQISYLSQPIYPNELNTIPSEYSTNFSFY
jgi:hypothetical protein